VTWRRLNYILHRDIGYLSVGLTMIYAVSGLAVNHIKDWNPSYRVETVHTRIDPLPDFIEKAEEAIPVILEQLGEKKGFENSFRPDPESIQIFVQGRSILTNLVTGEVIHDRAVPRPVLYELNALHLNRPKKLWTLVADIYAVALALLALTGLLMFREKSWLRSRGFWLMAAGVFIPLVAVLFL
jgi:hypothetical protein